MGLVPGGELWDVIHKEDENGNWQSGLSEDHAKFVTMVVADTLDFMHSKDYVFRDLKPENIMLDGDGYPVLIDFGFAKKCPDKLYTFVGTPNYVAPEIITNAGHDRCVDYWALGITVYEMVTGENPFYYENCDQVTLYTAICTEKHYPLPEERSKELVDFVDRILEKSPTERLGMLAGGVDDLFHHPWLSGLDLVRLRAKRWPSPWKTEHQLDDNALDEDAVLEKMGMKTEIRFPSLDDSTSQDQSEHANSFSSIQELDETLVQESSSFASNHDTQEERSQSKASEDGVDLPDKEEGHLQDERELEVGTEKSTEDAPEVEPEMEEVWEEDINDSPGYSDGIQEEIVSEGKDSSDDPAIVSPEREMEEVWVEENSSVGSLHNIKGEETSDDSANVGNTNKGETVSAPDVSDHEGKTDSPPTEAKTSNDRNNTVAKNKKSLPDSGTKGKNKYTGAASHHPLAKNQGPEVSSAGSDLEEKTDTPPTDAKKTISESNTKAAKKKKSLDSPSKKKKKNVADASPPQLVKDPSPGDGASAGRNKYLPPPNIDFYTIKNPAMTKRSKMRKESTRNKSALKGALKNIGIDSDDDDEEFQRFLAQG